MQICRGEELPIRGGDIDEPKRLALRDQRHAGVKKQTLVIARSTRGVSQACAFDDINGTCEASFDEELLAVACRRLAEMAAIVLFETGG